MQWTHLSNFNINSSYKLTHVQIYNWIVKSLIIKTDSHLTLVIICTTFGLFWNKLFCITPKLVSVWVFVKITFFCTENLKAYICQMQHLSGVSVCTGTVTQHSPFHKVETVQSDETVLYENVCLKVTWKFFFQYGNPCPCFFVSQKVIFDVQERVKPIKWTPQESDHSRHPSCSFPLYTKMSRSRALSKSNT